MCFQKIADNTYFYFPPPPTPSKSYYNCLLTIMDYLYKAQPKLNLIYITQSKTSYKILNAYGLCIYTCSYKNPVKLLNCILDYSPKKIVLLCDLDKTLYRTITLLFDCIELSSNDYPPFQDKGRE